MAKVQFKGFAIPKMGKDETRVPFKITVSRDRIINFGLPITECKRWFSKHHPLGKTHTVVEAPQMLEVDS